MTNEKIMTVKWLKNITKKEILITLIIANH